MSLQLLPPAPGKCPQCAVEHEPEQPHDATSMFYQFWFLGQHGRSPTWADAMAHCPEQVKLHWSLHLERLGIDLNSTQVRGGITSKEDLDDRLGRIDRE